MEKVIIAGGRDFNDYKLLVSECNRIIKGDFIEIVSGNARGADKIGEIYARAMGFQLKKFPADWDSLGKSAGHIRNKQMAEYADTLIAFWDGESKGTKNMISTATRLGLEVHVVFYGKGK